MTKIEQMARLAYFAFVDAQGYPNGLPTWNEMPPLDQKTWIESALMVVLTLIKDGFIRREDVTKLTETDKADRWKAWLEEELKEYSIPPNTD